MLYEIQPWSGRSGGPDIVVPPQIADPSIVDELMKFLLFGGTVWLGYQIGRELFREPRDTYRYDFFQGGRWRHSGVTRDLWRREGEHRRRYRGGRIRRIGRRTTRSAARAWERRMGY